jgi:hypothetical protein
MYHDLREETESFSLTMCPRPMTYYYTLLESNKTMLIHAPGLDLSLFSFILEHYSLQAIHRCRLALGTSDLILVSHTVYRAFTDLWSRHSSSQPMPFRRITCCGTCPGALETGGRWCVRLALLVVSKHTGAPCLRSPVRPYRSTRTFGRPAHCALCDANKAPWTRLWI